MSVPPMGTVPRYALQGSVKVRTAIVDDSPLPAVHAATRPALPAASTGYTAGASDANTIVSPNEVLPPASERSSRATAVRRPFTDSSHATTRRPRASRTICGWLGFGLPKIGTRTRAENVLPSRELA